MQKVSERELWTVPELAAYLGVAQRTAWKMVYSGDVPSVKLGGNVRIPREMLLRTIEAQAVERMSR
ncbi:MAG: helix-turn-helix domain-containing protein [Dehalococcoidia bacterium]